MNLKKENYIYLYCMKLKCFMNYALLYIMMKLIIKFYENHCELIFFLISFMTWYLSHVFILKKK